MSVLQALVSSVVEDVFYATKFKVFQFDCIRTVSHWEICFTPLLLSYKLSLYLNKYFTQTLDCVFSLIDQCITLAKFSAPVAAEVVSPVSPAAVSVPSSMFSESHNQQH